jgi:hypothetical protein
MIFNQVCTLVWGGGGVIKVSSLKAVFSTTVVYWTGWGWVRLIGFWVMMSCPSFCDVTKVIGTDNTITVQADICYMSLSVKWWVPQQQSLVICVSALLIMYTFDVNSVISGSPRWNLWRIQWCSLGEDKYKGTLHSIRKGLSVHSQQ